MDIERQILLAIFFMLAGAIILNSGAGKEIALNKRRKALLKEQRELIIGRRSRRVEKYVSTEQALIRNTQTTRMSYIVLMIASVIGGWLFGKLVFMDTFLSFMVAGACIILPHIYLVLKNNKGKREAAEGLESAMRIITHEYMQTLDLEAAVQNSVDIIDRDKPFREFLVDCKMVSANMERNLRRLETKENNIFFSRWIDQLILTQQDRTQMTNLTPILDEMNDAKTAQRQNDTKVAAAWRDYFTMLFIILLSPLLVRVIQYEWYSYLVTTFFGKCLVFALLASLVWATGRALKINQPITG